MRFAGSQLSNFIDPSNFDEISKTSMKGRSTERMYQAGAQATVDKAGIDAEAMIKSAKFGASATRAQGSAAGQSAMMGGISSGIGSLAGGFANMGGSNNVGTNRGATKFSQPHASGIGREALGGYDI